MYNNKNRRRGRGVVKLARIYKVKTITCTEIMNKIKKINIDKLNIPPDLPTCHVLYKWDKEGWTLWVRLKEIADRRCIPNGRCDRRAGCPSSGSSSRVSHNSRTAGLPCPRPLPGPTAARPASLPFEENNPTTQPIRRRSYEDYPLRPRLPANHPARRFAVRWGWS